MGGFSGGSSTGGGGGVGPAGRKSDGSYGTKRDAARASRRNEGRKAAKQVADFIRGGGITGAIVRGIAKSAKKSKAKKQANVEVGLGTDRMSNYSVTEGGTRGAGGRDNDRDNININPRKQNQGIEMANAAGSSAAMAQQKAVAEAPTGPTAVEMNQAEDQETEAERLLRIKRRGRKATILNVPEEELTLSRKVLLG